MLRFAIRRTYPLISLVLAALASCQDATAPHTAPGDAARARLEAFGFSLASISAGEGGACGVTGGGQAYCWGSNPYGVLGNGTTDPSGVPEPVSGGLTFTSVGGNELNACGLARGGKAFCWGLGSLGGLGNGTRDNSSVPVAVVGAITFTSLSSSRFGLGFTCGVAKGGNGYCWGIDGEGELGNGSSTPGLDFDTPVLVLGGLTFSNIVAGAYHTCGQAKGGELYCWGDNSSGQLGLGFFGSTLGEGSNVPARVSTALVFVQISAGYGYNCGVTKAGAGYCWGENGTGQLGDGSTTSRSAPVAIAGGLAFASVSAGTNSTCGITKNGATYCWGSNSFGQLGTGSAGNDPVTSPVQVSGGFNFTSISVGDGFACGTSKLGAFCWGDNESGKLGSGQDIAYAAAPVPVATP